MENLYDTVAIEYAQTFSDEHEKKPKDQEILHRFVQEIEEEGQSGISAVASVKPQDT